jgi:hypothetical protein
MSDRFGAPGGVPEDEEQVGESPEAVNSCHFSPFWGCSAVCRSCWGRPKWSRHGIGVCAATSTAVPIMVFGGIYTAWD